ncbi:MAG: 4-alpha-glucanotransferase [Deltaproteobacteria bacterium]|nr:4-alpha-glucanotransferase [Deltaproteobacteria bacterium]
MASLLHDRRSGVLLHPTSLAGPHGIGDFGPSARAFVDSIAAADQTWWQVLPLGPPAVADSPYQAISAFAGNPLLVSLEDLIDSGLLRTSELPAPRPGHLADFGYAYEVKAAAFRKASQRFMKNKELTGELERFRSEMGSWLGDFAKFAALKAKFDGKPWTEWPAEVRDRDPSAMELLSRELAAEIELAEIIQFLFHKQWRYLTEYAHAKKLRLMGDVPIFVAGDSADVWANRSVFRLDDAGQPIVVAGVPPDYFSEDGQLWGNPHYDWASLKATGYSWWVDRFRQIFRLVDAVRIDHFIGFVRAWEVQFGAKHARNGEWQRGPGGELFQAIKDALGDVSILAEDLGSVDAEVWAVRDAFDFPGMKVLQFAFGPDELPNEHQPHRYPKSSVAYTGTHDNDTTVGWYAALVEDTRKPEVSQKPVADGPKRPAGADRTPASARATLDHAHAFLRSNGSEIHWDMIHTLMGSVANVVIFPVQDLMGLETTFRMNTPGTASGNWRFRLPEGGIPSSALERLAKLTKLFDRSRVS